METVITIQSQSTEELITKLGEIYEMIASENQDIKSTIAKSWVHRFTNDPTNCETLIRP